jgi:hypothetical protein
VIYVIRCTQSGQVERVYSKGLKYGFSAIFLISLTVISSTGPFFTKPAAIHALSPHTVTRPTVTLWSLSEMFVLSRLCQQQMPCHSERALLWWFNIAGNNETFLGLLVKWPIFLSYFNQIWNSSVGFRRDIQYRISLKYVVCGPRWYLRTEGRTKSLTSFQPKGGLLWGLNADGNNRT